MRLELSSREARLLYDMLEIQIDGMVDGKAQSEADHSTFSNVEDFVSSMASYDEDIEGLRSIKSRIKEEL